MSNAFKKACKTNRTQKEKCAKQGIFASFFLKSLSLRVKIDTI
jgi:hypothetical protein